MPPLSLITALRQRPFLPFRMHLTDGTVFEIRHPELVMVAPGYAIVGLPPAIPQPAMIERHEAIDLLHVVRLEPLAASPTAGNGQ